MTLEQGQETQAWDAFLEASPLGQFQQASGWARVKTLEGWNTGRVFKTRHSAFHGGWQILWKTTRFGRIGFVNKGPVLRDESPAAIEASLQGIAAQARRLSLRAVILQPPDNSCITGADLCRQSFSNLPVTGVIDTTLVADVSGSIEELHERISRRVLRYSGQAVKQRVIAQMGGREDLPKFFDLISETCRRLGAVPNPASVESLRVLWDAFHPKVQLGLATVDGKTVAGLLTIGFGSRLTFWKKGWNSEKTDAHPNALLNIETLRWANAQGYTEADFVGCDRDFALSVLEGRPLTPAQQQSHHLFNLRLGARPRLLGPALVLIVNPGVRTLVSAILRVPGLRTLCLAGFRRIRGAH